mgnify:CR=1 FL=1
MSVIIKMHTIGDVNPFSTHMLSMLLINVLGRIAECILLFYPKIIECPVSIPFIFVFNLVHNFLVVLGHFDFSELILHDLFLYAEMLVRYKIVGVIDDVVESLEVVLAFPLLLLSLLGSIGSLTEA